MIYMYKISLYGVNSMKTMYYGRVNMMKKAENTNVITLLIKNMFIQIVQNINNFENKKNPGRNYIIAKSEKIH